MLNFPIYLDYASTTPIDISVYKKMLKYCFYPNKLFGNSSNNFHKFNINTVNAINKSKDKISNLINALPEEIIFTSGATESNNLVLKGLILSHFNKTFFPHIITSTIEHKSILNTCLYLEKLGCKISYLIPNNKGIININKILEVVNKNTILVSLSHVNNEIGVIQNINDISLMCNKLKILLHIDASQSLGKIPIDVKKNNITFLTASAHKLYGPQGIGFLFIKKNYGNKLLPQIIGGKQQNNVRSGTLPVHQIVAMAEACNIAKKIMYKEQNRILLLNKILRKGLINIKNIIINSNIKYSIPNIINISFKKLNYKKLIKMKKKIAFSYQGSSCNNNISHVLKSLNIDNNYIKNSIRLSIGRFTTKEEIIYTIKYIYNFI